MENYTINSTDGFTVSVPSSLALKSDLIKDINSLNKECTEFHEIEVEHEILQIIFAYLNENADDKINFIKKYHNMTSKNHYIPRILTGLYYLKIQDTLEEWCDYVASYMNKFGEVDKKDQKNKKNVSSNIDSDSDSDSYKNYIDQLFM